MNTPQLNWKILFLLAMLLGGSWLTLPGVAEPMYRDYAADLDEDLPEHTEAHLAYIKGHLDEPFDGYGRHEVFDSNFAVIALSHMAGGMMNIAQARPERRDELAQYTTEIVERALSAEVSPYDRSPEKVDALGRHGLYLSHLNLILGIHRHVSGATDHDKLHRRIARHLRRRSLAGNDWHAQSYPGSTKFQWPADQSVTLASLYLYDQLHGTRLSSEPIRGWLAYMKRHRDSQLDLPHSALPGSFDYASLPRGCALSWSMLYMAQFSPARAKEIYTSYRRAFGTQVAGWGGFREWPPGQNRGMDVDSGPIIFGMGMAATGLGIGPARIFGDGRSYTRIMRAASNVGLPSPSWPGGRRYRLAPLLGEAILFNGTTARVWFEDAPADAFDEEAEFPVGSVGFAVVFVVWAGLCVLGVRRELRAGKQWAHLVLGSGSP